VDLDSCPDGLLDPCKSADSAAEPDLTPSGTQLVGPVQQNVGWFALAADVTFSLGLDD
jgi:hypothetical protein